VGVFGVRLPELVARESAAGAVPAAVAACVHTLHCVGLETQGLFAAEVRAHAAPAGFEGMGTRVVLACPVCKSREP
jgi:hypothetical protein